jgi:hypothetical protein
MNDHTRRPLAQLPLGQVERCSCGVIYLTVGDITMRLNPPAWEELFALLRNARSQLTGPTWHDTPLA